MTDAECLLGFAWGPMTVTRIAYVEGRGYVLEIRTEHQSMQLYVSEKGRKIKAMPARAVKSPASTSTGLR